MKFKIIAAAVVLSAGLAVYFGFFHEPENARPTLMWGGQVVETKENSIVVEGSVVYSDEINSGQRESRTIEFKITSDTVLTNRARVITREQMESGEQFYPKDEDRPGKMEELQSGTGVVSIKSDKNLFKTNKAATTEIIYNTYELPF